MGRARKHSNLKRMLTSHFPKLFPTKLFRFLSLPQCICCEHNFAAVANGTGKKKKTGHSGFNFKLIEPPL